MQRFAFPGVLAWGHECRERASSLLSESNTVALWVDEFFAQTPFVRRLREELGSRLRFEACVTGMPRTATVDAALRAGAGGTDAVVALGGGSTLDAAKAVLAHRLYGTYDGVGMADRRGMPVLAGASKPLFVALPTTAGTGAENSRYYVTYDSATGVKVHGKSWRLLADWTLLDPFFLDDTPVSLLTACAFDAFVHHFESFLCRGERSWVGDMLSAEGVCMVIGALHAVLSGNHDGGEARLGLLYAASLGGIAISNIRTGNIHEAGGALLECSELTHPETLFVFLRAAIDQYATAVPDREVRLLAELAIRVPEVRLSSLDDVVAWWEGVFALNGLTESVAGKLARVSLPSADLEKYVVERVVADRVWAEKESPVPLSNADIEHMVKQSLRRFRHSAEGR